MGALHSWSNIFPEPGTDVVFLDRLKGISQDPDDYSVVTVQGAWVGVGGDCGVTVLGAWVGGEWVGVGVLRQAQGHQPGPC